MSLISGGQDGKAGEAGMVLPGSDSPQAGATGLPRAPSAQEPGTRFVT